MSEAAMSEAVMSDAAVERREGELTALLAQVSGGDVAALDALMALVYGELRQLAHHQRRKMPRAQLLNTTALVHEVYERFSRHGALQFHDRQHFFAAASRAMRQLLINDAEARMALKRGGGQTPLSLDAPEVQVASRDSGDRAALVLEVHRGLEALSKHDEALVQVVEYRFFVGMTHEEIATLQGVSEATVKRQWRRARAWLMTMLDGQLMSELAE